MSKNTNTVTTYVRGLNRRNFTSNTQRVLHTLLSAPDRDGWVLRSSIRVPSVGSRIRDLRKDEYGAFDVECCSAAELGRVGSKNTFYYRVNRKSVTLAQLRQVFER